MAHSTQSANPDRWLDVLLFSGIAVAAPFAFLLLVWMAWQASAIRPNLQQHQTAPVAALASATFTPTQVPTATPTVTPTATHTAIPATVPPPTATHTPTPLPTPTPSPVPTQPAPNILPAKTILIDLSDQTLTAFENDTPIFSTLVSTGQLYTPTPVGEFAIFSKIRSQTMSGPGYSLPNVEWVAYFYRSYAIHGTYWHDNFGHPMSHGCINMRQIDAQWLYGWAPIGTPVSVRQ